MQLNPETIRTLAVMLCDYAQIEGICLEPHEVDSIIELASAANFPQSTIEELWRIHALAALEMET